jgi:hypothetical protein
LNLATNSGAAYLFGYDGTAWQLVQPKITATCPKDTLGSGEAMTCLHSGTALTGQYENEATVRGEDDEGNEYTDDDPSHYYGYIPAAVGNYVWRDTNANGLQDDFEVGADDAYDSE